MVLESFIQLRACGLGTFAELLPNVLVHTDLDICKGDLKLASTNTNHMDHSLAHYDTYTGQYEIVTNDICNGVRMVSSVGR
eukprot:COSAG02_NODE_35054_length_474_cov_1.560000_2_plen_81_part_00